MVKKKAQRSKYAVIYSGCDRGFSTPYAGVVGNKVHSTYSEAFMALIEEFKRDAEVVSKDEFTEAVKSGELDGGEWPSRKNRGKCSLGYFKSGDSTVTYSISEVEV